MKMGHHKNLLLIYNFVHHMLLLFVSCRHGRRPIPESELGLAVLYVSTALHCNPVVAQGKSIFDRFLKGKSGLFL